MTISGTRRASEEGSAPLRPRARIMRTLGDELISSEVVAVIELVKNAYDADATRVLVRLHEPLQPGEGRIDIIDDGHGMTLETVLSAWMEPATPFRRNSRRSEAFGRHVLGEKGIGRFAVSRLADELELVTRRPDADVETRVLFDWRLFDNDEAYLDEIDLVWEQTEPTEIAPGGLADELWPEAEPPDPSRLNRGTTLRMAAVRTEWGEGELRALRDGLARLVSPFLFEEQRHRPDGFLIRLEVPDRFADLSGVVEPPEALRNPHYTLTGKVSDEGEYSVTMTVRGGDGKIQRSGRVEVEGERWPASGPFTIELRVWDRDPESMSELASRLETSTRLVRQDLNNAAGVSIYRDGFRVLPYGESGDDWLQLDSRRVNNPTLRLSNNQIVGYVLISRDENPELRDQTNREGLLQNQAFDDLRRSVRSIIARLEEERYAVRPREKRTQPRAGGLFAGLNISPLRSYISEQYAGDNELARLLGEAQQNLDEGVERAQEVVARYHRLATLGELIDKVLHDGRAPLAKIGGEAQLARRDIDRSEVPCDDLVAALRERFVLVENQHDVLDTVFRRIEPFGGRRRGRPTDVLVESIIRDAFGVLETDIIRLGVSVDLPDSKTTVTVDPAELQEVLVNLLANSLHWLKEVPRGTRQIRVQVDSDRAGLSMIFSDSGPGVRDEVRDHIFDPYYSTKENGVGLGLNIAGELVQDFYDGSLDLLDSGPLSGATFRVTLRRRV